MAPAMSPSPGRAEACSGAGNTRSFLRHIEVLYFEVSQGDVSLSELKVPEVGSLAFERSDVLGKELGFPMFTM
jgi:hypothetical protein